MVMDAVGSAVSDLLGFIKPDKAKLAVVGSKSLPSDLPANLPDKEPYEIEFMFNPTEYSITQPVTVNNNTTASTAGGTPEYGGAGPMTIGLTMFLDDYASLKGDVTPKVTTLLNWTKPTEESRKNGKPCAPLVGFIWGGNPQLKTFRGFLSNVQVTYLIFRKDGRPVQAKVVLAIQGQQLAPDGTNPTSRATSSHRTHTMIEGDTLQSVATSELGKPAFWRAIADLNGIDDPLRVASGITLLIPTAVDAARGS